MFALSFDMVISDFKFIMANRTTRPITKLKRL